MSAKVRREFAIPEGVQLTLENNHLTVKGEKGELVREFKHPSVKITLEKEKLIIGTTEVSSEERELTGTWESHIKNMIKGVTEGFKCTLKAVYSHFPMDIKPKEGYIEINNFLGEKAARKSKIVGSATVNIQKTDVEVEGINKEEVGQTAANLEQATKVKKRDTRVFQDGIYITEKP